MGSSCTTSLVVLYKPIIFLYSQMCLVLKKCCCHCQSKSHGVCSHSFFNQAPLSFITFQTSSLLKSIIKQNTFYMSKEVYNMMIFNILSWNALIFEVCQFQAIISQKIIQTLSPFSNLTRNFCLYFDENVIQFHTLYIKIIPIYSPTNPGPNSHSPCSFLFSLYRHFCYPYPLILHFSRNVGKLISWHFSCKSLLFL